MFDDNHNPLEKAQKEINSMLKREGQKINSHLHHLEEQLLKLSNDLDSAVAGQKAAAAAIMHLTMNLGLHSMLLQGMTDILKEKYPEAWNELETEIERVKSEYNLQTK
jgi:archaellum component FlaC